MIWNVLDVETAFIQAILQYKSLIICKTNSSCNSFLVETKFYLLKYELGCEIMKAVASKLFPEKKNQYKNCLNTYKILNRVFNQYQKTVDKYVINDVSSCQLVLEHHCYEGNVMTCKFK
jgi:hypothetical protein